MKMLNVLIHTRIIINLHFRRLVSFLFHAFSHDLSFPLRVGFGTFKKDHKGCRAGHRAISLTATLDSILFNF